MSLELRPLSDSTYTIFIKLLKGTFNKPVKDRTLSEKNAVITFWRRKDQLRLRKVNTGEVLYYKKKIILKKTQFKKKVLTEFRRLKGCGARAIAYSLKEEYAGVSEREVRKILKYDQKHGQIRAKFSNKAPIKTISAKKIFERVQIDLINMTDNAVQYNTITYKYILTAIDIFSRFVFLKAIPRKTTKYVANALEDIFSVHGYPSIVQSDQGREFLGEVKRLLEKEKVRVIKSRPYHPQSQGKVERQNRSVKQKIKFDLMKKRRKGYNWVKSLSSVTKVINNQPKEVLGYQTPFTVYFGRGKNNPSSDAIRKKAYGASERCSRREMLKDVRLHGCSIYNQKEKILIRYPTTNRRIPTRHCVLKGLILKRDKSYSKYFVQFRTPDKELKKQWINVEFITSLTQDKEKTRRQASNNLFRQIQKKRMHREKYLIPLESADDEELHKTTIVEDRNIGRNLNEDVSDINDETRDQFFNSHDGKVVIVMNPNKYGNCQFDAVSDQIKKIGLYRTGQQLRNIAVRELRGNRQYFEDFVDDERGFDVYVARMSRPSTYGDHLTLQTLAIEFHCQFFVLSVQGRLHHRIVSVTDVFDPDVPLLTLGYYPEDKGEHYVSVEIEPHFLNHLLHGTAGVVQISSVDDHPYNSDAPTEGYDNHADNNSYTLSEGYDHHAAHNPDASTEEYDGHPYNSGDQTDEFHMLDFSEQQETVRGEVHSEFPNTIPTQDIAGPNHPSVLPENENLPVLPDLVIETIIKVCVQKHPEMLFTLQHVSTFVRHVITTLGYPRIYLCPAKISFVPPLISVRRLIRLFGRNSGLMIDVREMLMNFGSRWVNAWLSLEAIRYNWFEVRDVSWR